MAYTIPLNSILEYTIPGFHNNQQTLSIFHYKLVGGSIPLADGRISALDFLVKIQAAGKLYDTYMNAVSQDFVCTSHRAQWIHATRYSYVSGLTGVQAGQVAQDALPQNVAAAITKTGELANRHNVGTLHMPAVPITFVTGGEITAAGFIAYNDVAAQVKADIVLTAGQTMRPVIFNRTDPAASVEVKESFTQDTSRVARRRTVGLGI